MNMKTMGLMIGAWICVASVLRAGDVAITAATNDPSGGYAVTTPNYTARIGSDGNLHSLISDGAEFLLDGYKGLVGGGYMMIQEGPSWSVEVFKYTTVTQSAPDAVTATADKHQLVYKFLPDAIEMGFIHTVPPTIWLATLNRAVTNMIERISGETVPPKTVWREGRLQLVQASGANVTFPDGVLLYIAKNATEKPDADPEIMQIWMPQTGPNSPMTKTIKVHAKPTLEDALNVQLVMARANHIYPAGEPIHVGLEGFIRFAGLNLDGQAELRVLEMLTQKETVSKTEPFKLNALGQGKVGFDVQLPPGFYTAVLTVKQGNELLAERKFPLVYDMANMKSPERPADFDKFWDDTLAEQEKIPACVQLTFVREEPTHKLYKMQFDGLAGRKFHAWLSVPVKPGKYPAQLTLPPSGINVAYMPASGPNVVGMTLAIAGQEVEQPPEGFKYWDYWRSGIEKRETWYYRVVYAACSRAVDILAARPEVDATKISVGGGSQGGGLSFITAALNPKVGLAICGSPGLFGLEWKLRYLPLYWPPITFVDASGQPVTPDPKQLEERIAVVRYGDAANFAPRIKGSVLLNVGLQDVVTSQVGVPSCWSRIMNARIKGLLADPWGGHNGPRGGQALGSQWQIAFSEGQIERVLSLTTAPGCPPVIVEAGKSGSSPK